MTPEEIAAANKKRAQAMAKMLAKVLGKTVKQIEESLDAENGVVQLQEELDDHFTELENDNVNKGYKSLKGQLIKLLKKAGLTVTDDVKIDDALVESLQTHFKGADGDKPKDETEEIKTLKQKIADLNKQLSTKDEEHTAAIEKLTKEHARKEQESGINAFVGKLVKELNGKIPTDEDVAAEKLKRMIKGEDLLSKNWKWDDKKKDYIEIDEDGTPVTENGSKVTLRTKVSANLHFYYDKVNAKAKDSGGLPKDKAAGGATDDEDETPTNFKFEHFKGKIPLNRADVDKILDDFNQTPDAIAEVQKYNDTVLSKKDKPDNSGGGGDDE